MNVEPPVKIVVAESHTETGMPVRNFKISPPKPAFLGKGAVSVVHIKQISQRIPGLTCDTYIQISIAIVVDITPRRPVARSNHLDPGKLTHTLKRSIAQIAKEGVGALIAGHKQINPTIIIKISDRSAPGHHLGHMLHPSRRCSPLKVTNFSFIGDIHERSFRRGARA